MNAKHANDNADVLAGLLLVRVWMAEQTALDQPWEEHRTLADLRIAMISRTLGLTDEASCQMVLAAFPQLRWGERPSPRQRRRFSAFLRNQFGRFPCEQFADADHSR